MLREVVGSSPTRSSMEKLYVVVRSDLHPGAQCAQSVHAALLFAHEHAELEAEWHEQSKNLVVLGAADEAHLRSLASKAAERGFATSEFHEPDFDDALTAVGFEYAAWRMLSSLPKALRDEKLTDARSAA